jgi:hypothetical protein
MDIGNGVRRGWSAPTPFIALVLTFISISPSTVESHDIYSGLKSKVGNSCCDKDDCRPAQYQITPAGVLMRVGQEWIAVHPDTIQYRAISGDSGETAGGHWCGRQANDPLETGYVTFCAILPPRLATSAVSHSH